MKKCGRVWLFSRTVSKAATLLLLAMLAGCATIPECGPAEREKLVKASNDYNMLLRWKELDKACITFMMETERKNCLERVPSLKDVQITDIRTRDIDFRIDGFDATVNAEIEYYALPSTTVKKTLDSQKWVYEGPVDNKTWRIKSFFPKFTAP